MKYIKQLDAVRAIAVLLVMISHWVPPDYFINKLPNGPLGVDIFFVLSGFLIAWILLANRQKAEAEDLGKGTIIKNFYVRRTLRIFPIYYILISLLLIFHSYTDTDIRTSYPWYFTYTSNFHIYNQGTWYGVGIVSHLWSLAVEEQFYLIWPALMLFVNRKYLLHVIYGFIAIGIVSQILLFSDSMSSVLTPTCFHAFGAGAILAWIIVYHKERLPAFYKLTKILGVIAFILLLSIAVKPEWGVGGVFRVISSTLGIFIITYLVYKAPSGRLRLGFIWNNKVLIFLGKISYGLYLYHNIIPYYTNKLVLKMGISVAGLLPYKMGYLLMIGINFVILLIISWLSWMIIEKPILGLKKYFEYTGDEKQSHQPGIERVNEISKAG